MAVIRTERLTKHYGGSPALVDLDLEVAAGEVFGYLGPNGSGKTTTIRLLLGLIRPTAGRAEVLGGDAQRDTVAIHRRLAYVPGDAALWPALTGAETLHLLGRIHGTVDRPTATSWWNVSSWIRASGCGPIPRATGRSCP